MLYTTIWSWITWIPLHCWRPLGASCFALGVISSDHSFVLSSGRHLYAELFSDSGRLLIHFSPKSVLVVSVSLPSRFQNVLQVTNLGSELHHYHCSYFLHMEGLHWWARYQNDFKQIVRLIYASVSKKFTSLALFLVRVTKRLSQDDHIDAWHSYKGLPWDVPSGCVPSQYSDF